MDIKRLFTALVLMPLIFALIHYAQPIMILPVIILMGIAALNEFITISLPGVSSGEKIFCLILNSIVITFIYFTERATFGIILTLVILVFINIKKNKEHAIVVNEFLREFLGIIYCGALISFLLLIRLLDGKEYLYLLLLSVWAVDAFAYYIGSYVGKVKLLPNISPKKTVIGALSGILGAVVVTVASKYIYFYHFTIYEAVILGVLVSFSAQVGDLFESLIKREKGVKDSGKLIPGHGGMLDRIDSLLFAAPVFFYFTLLLNL